MPGRGRNWGEFPVHFHFGEAVRRCVPGDLPGGAILALFERLKWHSSVFITWLDDSRNSVIPFYNCAGTMFLGYWLHGPIASTFSRVLKRASQRNAMTRADGRSWRWGASGEES